MGSSSDFSGGVRKLEGKVALITGGASGIGESTARVFCRHGAKVVIADIQDALGNSVCNDLGSATSFVHCNVTNEDDIIQAIDHTITLFGKLDIMFNNAGIIGDTKPSIVDNEKANLERVLGVNVVGPFLGAKHAARVMIPARQGTIITTASIASTISGAGTHAYTCSKSALVGLMKNLAVELGQFGIRVNCVSPAGVATPLTTRYMNLDSEGVEKTMGSLANLKAVTLKAEDIANAVLYLASEDSRYVSGHNLVVDGGMSIVNPSIGRSIADSRS